MTLKTSNSKCKYCNAKADKNKRVCSNCYKKLKLIRQIKQIGEEIKKHERGDNYG